MAIFLGTTFNLGTTYEYSVICSGQSIINYRPTSPERILCQGGSSKNKKLQEKIKIG